MANFTLRHSFQDVFTTCFPTIATRRRDDLREDLIRRESLHALKLNDLETAMGACSARAKAYAQRGDRKRAIKEMRDRRRIEGDAKRAEHLTRLCAEAYRSLDEDYTTFETVAVLTEVQRHHKPNDGMMSKLDAALDGLRDLHDSSSEVSGALENGIIAVDDDDLEAELDQLLREDDAGDPDTDPALGLPAAPRHAPMERPKRKETAVAAL